MTTSFDLIQLAIGSLMLTGAVLYWLWLKVRVVFLRQELFRLRDHLWDVAQTKGLLDDPAYACAREHLNACIRAAMHFSVTMFQCTLNDSERSERPSSADPQFSALIDETYAECGRLLARYVLFWRLSGWLYLCGIGSQLMIQSLAQQWVNSDSPEQWSRFDRNLKMRSAN